MTAKIINFPGYTPPAQVAAPPTPTPVPTAAPAAYTLPYPAAEAHAEVQRVVAEATADVVSNKSLAVAMVFIHPIQPGAEHPVFEWHYTLTGSSSYDHALLEAIQATATEVAKDIESPAEGTP